MSLENLIPVIIVFAVVFIAIAFATRRNSSPKEQYDERQELLRKNAYKYSATTMALCAIVYFIITTMAEKQFAEDGVSALLIVFLGIAVFAVYSIFNDSFFGIKGKRGSFGRPAVYVLILVIIIIGNGVGAVRMIRENELVKNGLLTSNVLNLALAALFLLVLIALGIKYVMNVREDREAEQ